MSTERPSPSSKFPPSVVLSAALRRDALLRGRRSLPALAAIALLQGSVAAGACDRGDCPTLDRQLLDRQLLGRQLLDLKAARDAGALSASEYESARSLLLRLGRAEHDGATPREPREGCESSR